VVGGLKKHVLLQMYLVERRRINKLYKKLFTKLHISTVFIYLIVSWRNMGHKVEYMKFRTFSFHVMYCKLKGEALCGECTWNRL